LPEAAPLLPVANKVENIVIIIIVATAAIAVKHIKHALPVDAIYKPRVREHGWQRRQPGAESVITTNRKSGRRPRAIIGHDIVPYRNERSYHMFCFRFFFFISKSTSTGMN